MRVTVKRASIVNFSARLSLFSGNQKTPFILELVIKHLLLLLPLLIVTFFTLFTS